MSFPSPDTDIYYTGQTTVGSEGNSVGRLPTHSLPPLQSTPVAYSDYHFNKQQSKTIIPKKSTMKKKGIEITTVESLIKDTSL